MATPPSTTNYFIGKGNVYMKAVDAADSTYAHIGNCPRFTLTPHHEFLQHFTQVGGIRIMDEVQLASRAVDVSIDAEEFTLENLALALGANSIGGGVYRVTYAFVQRAVRFVGSNDKGPQAIVVLPRVLFTVDSDIEFISDSYGKLPLRGHSMYYPKTAGGTDYTFVDFAFSTMPGTLLAP